MSGAMSSNVVRTIFAVIMSTIGMVSLGQVGSFGDYSEGVYRQGDYRDLLGVQVHKRQHLYVDSEAPVKGNSAG